MDELEEQLADAKVRLRCKQQPIKVSWSACCSQEEVEKERARAFDLQATVILFVATIFLKELKKTSEMKMKRFPRRALWSTGGALARDRQPSRI